MLVKLVDTLISVKLNFWILRDAFKRLIGVLRLSTFRLSTRVIKVTGPIRRLSVHIIKYHIILKINEWLLDIFVHYVVFINLIKLQLIII